MVKRKYGGEHGPDIKMERARNIDVPTKIINSDFIDFFDKNVKSYPAKHPSSLTSYSRKTI
jgi:hypothetical protein